MKKSRFYCISVIIFFCLNLNLFGQPQSDTPLRPAEREPDKGLGFFIGLGQSFQTGKFITECDCYFEDGVGFSYLFGALYEREISTLFDYGIMGFFENKSIKASYQEYEVQKIFSTATQDSLNVPIQFRHIGETEFNSVSLAPFIKFTPAKFLFFRLGFRMGYLMSGKVKHTKELLQRTAYLPTGEIVEITIGDKRQTSVVVEDGDYPELNAFQMALLPMVGFNIRIENNLYFYPSFMFDYSLTDVSKRGDGFKLHSWKVLLELKYQLSEQSKY